MAGNTPELRNPKHQLFAEEYLRTGNARQSAIKAGYSFKTASSQASLLLQHDAIAPYIAARRASTLAQTDVTREQIVAELKDLAFFNIQDITRVDADGRPHLDLTNTTRDQFKAISSISTKSRVLRNKDGEVIGTEQQSKVTVADKYRGLELLGKTLGIFQEPEVKVTLDVADRLLNARNRLARLNVIDTTPSDADP